MLPKSKVSMHKFEYYKTREVPIEKLTVTDNYPHLRLAISGGYSHSIGKVSESVPEDFKKYVEDLKSGTHIGGDINYYFNENFGFGAKYYLFSTSNSLENIYLIDETGKQRYGDMSDELTVKFIVWFLYTVEFNNEILSIVWVLL